MLTATLHKSKNPQVSTLVPQGRFVGNHPEKSIFSAIKSILSFSTGISKMTLAISCGSGERKKHLTKGKHHLNSKNIYKLFGTVFHLFQRHHLYWDIYEIFHERAKASSGFKLQSVPYYWYIVLPKVFIEELKFVSGYNLPAETGRTHEWINEDICGYWKVIHKLFSTTWLTSTMKDC